MDALSEDEMLRMALEASVHDMAGRSADASPILATSHTKTRASMPRADHHAPPVPVDGMVLQYNTINQFHDLFAASIREFSTAAAICGYMTVAHCRVIKRYLDALPVPGALRTQADVDGLLALMRDETVAETEILPHVREAMQMVWLSRQQVCVVCVVLARVARVAVTRERGLPPLFLSFLPCLYPVVLARVAVTRERGRPTLFLPFLPCLSPHPLP